MNEAATFIDDLKSYLQLLSESGTTELALSDQVLEQLDTMASTATTPAPAPEPDVPPPAPTTTEATPQPDAPPRSLEALQASWKRCNACNLHKGGNTRGRGQGEPVAPEIMFIGATPTSESLQEEDVFSDRPGQLLAKMIAAMGLSTTDIYVTSLCKCPTPGNRNPTPREIQACIESLKQEVALVKPTILVAMGSMTVHALAELPAGKPFNQIHGHWSSFCNTPLMPTYSAQELLEDPSRKRAAWEDLKAVLTKLGKTPPA